MDITWSKEKEAESLPMESIVYYDTTRKLFVAHRGNKPSKANLIIKIQSKTLE